MADIYIRMRGKLGLISIRSLSTSLRSAKRPLSRTLRAQLTAFSHTNMANKLFSDSKQHFHEDLDEKAPPPAYDSLLDDDASTLAPGAGRTLVFRASKLWNAFVLRDEAAQQDVYSGSMPLFKRKAPSIQLHAGPDKSAPAVAAVQNLWHTTQQMGLGDPARPEAMTWTSLRPTSTWDTRLNFEADVDGRLRPFVWERGPYAAAEADGKRTSWGGLPCALRYTLTDAATGEALARSTIIDKWSWTRAGSIRFLKSEAELGPELAMWAILSYIVATMWVCGLPGVLQAETASASVAIHREKKEAKARDEAVAAGNVNEKALEG